MEADRTPTFKKVGIGQVFSFRSPQKGDQRKKGGKNQEKKDLPGWWIKEEIKQGRGIGGGKISTNALHVETGERAFFKDGDMVGLGYHPPRRYIPRWASKKTGNVPKHTS